VNNEEAAVAGDDGGALRPICLDLAKPLGDQVAEAAGRRVLCGAKLIAKSCRTHNWDATRNAVDYPAFPGKPEVEIENAWLSVTKIKSGPEFSSLAAGPSTHNRHPAV
jgi:hypothetical protein